MGSANSISGQRLLIVVSDREGLGKSARAGERQVRRWLAGVPGTSVASDAYFTGDPGRLETYAWAKQARAVSAVIDLHDDVAAEAALDAVRAARPDAAVLVLSEGIKHPPGDGTLTRAGDLRDVLRLDLDEELQRLEAERRVHRLREFVDGEAVVPVVIHPDPDPDAISSALALRTILRRGEQQLPIVTLRAMMRPENRRMVELLEASITEVTHEQLRPYARLIVVDSQPRGLGQGRRGAAGAGGHAAAGERASEAAGEDRRATPTGRDASAGDESRVRFAVIDHHPVEAGYEAEFWDVRPEYGATATIMTEYLRADSRMRLSDALAAALLYGIKTDTDGLMRGVTPADVAAYAFLQEQADTLLLRRFERPAYAVEAAKAFGRAVAGMAKQNDLAVACARGLAAEQLHVLADLADFCLGVEGIAWAVAAAVLDDQLVLTVRHLGDEPGAGALACALAEHGGSGGGHTTMGRVVLRADAAREWVGGDFTAAQLLERLRAMIDRLR